MAAAGDVVMNLGDPFYPLAPGDVAAGSRLTSSDVVARLLAYGVVAETVILASRYVLSGGPLYEALRLAPQLLTSGLVRIDLYEGVDSFEDLVRHHGYPPEALPRAAWLDEHVTARMRYRPEDQGAIYHATLMADLAPGGALRRYVRGGQRGAAARQLDRIQQDFAACPADRQRFVEVAAAHLPRQVALFRRWAAMRYYTVPMLFDPPGRIREVPKSAASLVGAAGPSGSPHSPTRARAVAGLDETTPVDPVLRQLLLVPALTRGTDPDAVRQVVDALLAVRERHRDARRAFLRIVEGTSANPVDLRDALRREMARQHRMTIRSARRARMMQWVGVGIGLGSTAAGLGMSPELSTVLGVATTLAPTAIDLAIARLQDRRRPWVLAHEEVTRVLSRPEIAGTA